MTVSEYETHFHELSHYDMTSIPQSLSESVG